MTGGKQIVCITLVPNPFVGVWVLVLNFDVMVDSVFQRFRIQGISSSLEDDLINIERLVEIGFDPEILGGLAISWTDVSSSGAVESWVAPSCIPLGTSDVLVAKVDHGSGSFSWWFWGSFLFLGRDDEVGSGTDPLL